MGRYRFALTPRWILGHVLVVLLVVVMVNLGFWQLGRLEEKRDRNDQITSRQEEPVVPVQDVMDPDTPQDEVDQLVYRRVSATGTYLTDQQVVVRNRSFEGAPGEWVLTPVLLEDGTAVGVSRGWQNIETPAERSAPPSGEVQVEGYVQATQERGSFGPTDPEDGTVETLARVDVQRLQQQVDEPLLPGWVQLVEQDPEQDEPLPVPVPLPELDEGPHLGYAGQWFLFCVVAVVGWIAIIRRAARDREVDARAEDDGPGDEGAPAEPDPAPASTG
jgi:cytochrome oxidase assembly protein ShyY1